MEPRHRRTHHPGHDRHQHHRRRNLRVRQQGWYGIELNSIGQLAGYRKGKKVGYIDYSGGMYEVSNPSKVYYGLQLQGGCLRISTPILSVAKTTDTHAPPHTPTTQTPLHLQNHILLGRHHHLVPINDRVHQTDSASTERTPMPRITRYWAHDPIGNSEGILAGYEPAALKAAQDRGIIFIAELDDGTRLRVDASDVTEPEPASYTIATPDYVASRVTLITDALDAVADILDPQPTRSPRPMTPPRTPPETTHADACATPSPTSTTSRKERGK